MSKLPKRSKSAKLSQTKVSKSIEPRTPTNIKDLFRWVFANWLTVFIIAMVALGVVGSGLSYLERAARDEIARRDAANC